jgi:multidrug efflux pump subunit AcrA (membrane-fusion protein)
MKKRQWAIVAAIVVLGLALLVKNLIQTPPDEESISRNAAARGVAVFEVKNGTVPTYIRVNGKLSASQKIDLYAEVTGLLQPGTKPFETGISYQKGQTLIRLENAEAQSAYETAKSNYINTITRVLPDLKIDFPESFDNWFDYLSSITSSGSVKQPATPSDDKLRLFLTGQGVYRDYQNLVLAKVRLEKYVISAPFTGTLTEAFVETGSLVRPGQPLGEFIAEGNYELEVTVSEKDLSLINLGDTVYLKNNDNQQEYKGTVFRKNAKVNANSLRVSIIIKLSNSNLRDGMFLSGRIRGSDITNAIALPRNLVLEQNLVYTIKDSVLAPLRVQIAHKTAEQVVAKNLPQGTLIPKEPVPGAYSGMPIKIIKGN